MYGCLAQQAFFAHKFTGKERDSESRLDYFGARYYSWAQGRLNSPDAPFADQNPEDPQSWNLYAYVRNNPLAYFDPSGRACFSLNIGSAYCARATLYGLIDAKASAQTRFFAAASATNQLLANLDVPVLSSSFVSSSFVAGPSEQTKTFLSTLGKDLEGINITIAASIKEGALGGPGLDAELVRTEQAKVQESLDSLQKADRAGYEKVIGEINATLNPTGLGKFAVTRFGTDKAYSQILDAVRKDLGASIDFANQKHREAIGNKLIEHLRRSGGCDVTDNKVKKCTYRE
jgi:RHS repeat-associated protein